MTVWRQGVYRILEDAEDAGMESWLIDIGQSTVTVHLDIERIRPVARNEEVTIQLTNDWRPLSLSVLMATSSGLRSYDGQRSGHSWISQVIQEDGAVAATTLAFDDNTHVDYFTPLTNTITIRRLRLQPGEARELSVVYVDTDDLSASLVGQRYEQLADGPVPGLDENTRLHCYRFSSVDADFSALIWTDEDEIVVRYEDLFELILA